MHYSSVKPSCSNSRVITANVLGGRIFRKITVDIKVLTPLTPFRFTLKVVKKLKRKNCILSIRLIMSLLYTISGLTNMEIFEKDLKMVSGPSMNIAMSSVTMDMLVGS